MGPCKQIASAISKAMKRRFISGSLAYGHRAVACAKSQAFPRRGRFYLGLMDAFEYRGGGHLFGPRRSCGSTIARSSLGLDRRFFWRNGSGESWFPEDDLSTDARRRP
jgi:hypothetical protein